MSLAAAEDLLVRYGAGAPALGPVSLALRPGTAIALLGPSGCGKSTLLGALAGLVSPSEGQAHPGAATPGVVFQEATLLPWLSALDNVALPLTLAGEKRRSACAKARAALTAVGLPAAEKLRPRELSGGMRMRVALARALVGEPNALLLDEPFAAIDELGRRALDDLLLALKAERNLAVLFVTHSVEEAVYIGDVVAVMSPRPGRIVAEIPVPAPAGPRGDAFLASEPFREAAKAARAALSGAHA